MMLGIVMDKTCKMYKILVELALNTSCVKVNFEEYNQTSQSEKRMSTTPFPPESMNRSTDA